MPKRWHWSCDGNDTTAFSNNGKKKTHSTGDKTSLTTVLSRERKRQTEAGITDGITGAKRQGQHISREKWMSDGEVSDGWEWNDREMMIAWWMRSLVNGEIRRDRCSDEWRQSGFSYGISFFFFLLLFGFNQNSWTGPINAVMMMVGDYDVNDVDETCTYGRSLNFDKPHWLWWSDCYQSHFWVNLRAEYLWLFYVTASIPLGISYRCIGFFYLFTFLVLHCLCGKVVIFKAWFWNLRSG